MLSVMKSPYTAELIKKMRNSHRLLRPRHGLCRRVYMNRRTIVMSTVFMIIMMFGIGDALAKACIWEGRAPVCNGKCRAGYKKIKESKKGPKDGKRCVTGKKVYCCKKAAVEIFGRAPICNGKCPKGWTRVGDSKNGEKGKKCLTGVAAQCVKKL